MDARHQSHSTKLATRALAVRILELRKQYSESEYPSPVLVGAHHDMEVVEENKGDQVRYAGCRQTKIEVKLSRSVLRVIR